MAKRITAEERERIIAAFATGSSCHQIAKDFGRSSNTISRIAKSVGHKFAHANALRAREAQEAHRIYGAERRANIRLKTVEVIEERLREFDAPTLVYNFGGKDNDYNEHILAKPDARIMRDLAQTIATLWRVVESIDKAEQGESDTAGFDVIFRQLDQVADEYERQAIVQPETGGGDQPE